MTGSKLRMEARKVWMFMTTYENQVDTNLREEYAGARPAPSRLQPKQRIDAIKSLELLV